MAESRDFVLGRSASPAEDELRLPPPPGVIRRFWARHPWWADILLVLLCLLLLSLSAVAATDQPLPAGFVPGTVISLFGCIGLLMRRRWPVAVFVVAVIPAVLAPAISTSMSGLAPVIALYSIAVYRSSRAALVALGVVSAVLAGSALVWALAGNVPADDVGFVIGTVLIMAIGVLTGVNVGNRKRYVAALIDRSRQLAVERDQQAQLAASAERTRIAREMHDIVSHSLTVVVALADGAAATDDPERAREASLAVAATAREALAEMRVMLGVLRSDTGPPDDDAPMEPLLDMSVQDVTTAARNAGFPVSLTVTGAPRGSAAHRLAVLRIVQEGLTNAMRYAHSPTAISVVTDYSGERATIVVDNDGVLPGEDSKGAGVGLQGLRERVTSLGGELSAGPHGAGSWRLHAELPIERDHD